MGQKRCGEKCVDIAIDPTNCGTCGYSCRPGEACTAGYCEQPCTSPSIRCLGICVDRESDALNCGQCGKTCKEGDVCFGGACGCPGGGLVCSGACTDILNSSRHCGGCDQPCLPGQGCLAGACTLLCPGPWLKCGSACVDPRADNLHCGGCGVACSGGSVCQQGVCSSCNSSTVDCDGDGFRQSDGDCCDLPGACGAQPQLVNPGALERVGDGVDENCDGRVDEPDDFTPCDGALTSSSGIALDYAKALGLCRRAVENPPQPAGKTWGLIDAWLVQADGASPAAPAAASIRGSFGQGYGPKEGASMAVLSSGIASDAIQGTPGPNGGPSSNVSTSFNLEAQLLTCSSPRCIGDWLTASNPPRKQSGELPVAPSCGSGNAGGPGLARDSIMLVLRIRAPTNVRSFALSSNFFSAEYPEYVCTDFNDQLIALVDTPGGSPAPVANPLDKNLMTYFEGGQFWPIGINVASGTDLFKVCSSKMANPGCWDAEVSAASCSLGDGPLQGTGFEGSGGSCSWGGATGWLTTAGNVRPGEILELRIAIWDVGDHIFDSAVLLDAFRWQTQWVEPGTSG